MEQNKFPRGGIGIFLVNYETDKVLIGKRKDNSLFALPGGWLERWEELEECGSRELKEETDLYIPASDLKHLRTYNCLDSKNNYHNVAFYLWTKINSMQAQKVKNMEPEKCENWMWVELRFIKENLEKFFFPNKLFIEKHYNELDNANDLEKILLI
jgi:8-oxo-dGTP diphosphatase